MKVVLLVFSFLGLLFSFVFLPRTSAQTLDSAVLERLQRHAQFHYPVIALEEIKARPYVTLPFKKADLKDGVYDIREGWLYSKAESAIHGKTIHAGVDFSVPYGTPIISPVDGYSMASYHSKLLKDENGEVKKYKGKDVWFGGGYFVQIYVPSVKRFIELEHLSSVDPKIPFSPPTKTDEGFEPTNVKIPISEIPDNKNYVQIKKGEVIGTVGYSGLILGDKLDYTQGMEKAPKLNQSEYESWDEPHVHFEEFWRIQENPQENEALGDKVFQRDPYGIYDTFEQYPTPIRKKEMGQDPLFLLDKNGMPQFAAE